MNNGRREKTIDRATLRRYVNDGLTLQQMADRWYEETGVKRARSSFAVALGRYDMKSAHPRTRYSDVLPWRLRNEHAMSYEARMLRLLGRRKRDLSMSSEDTRRLNSFLRELDEDNKVIYYDRRTPQGFWYVEKQPGDSGYIRVPDDIQA